MIIAVILGGILAGYFVGCYALDRWINTGQQDTDGGLPQTDNTPNYGEGRNGMNSDNGKTKVNKK